MIRNSAVAAALVLMLGLFWLLGETTFLAPYRRLLVVRYGWTILAGLLLVYVNLVAAFYLLGRTFFLRGTGQKLTHVDKQLAGPDTIAAELSAQIEEHPEQ
ncbi:MAG: hypothetical protein ACRD2X_07785 [Vicinamibacteraceae bacterium]